MNSQNYEVHCLSCYKVTKEQKVWWPFNFKKIVKKSYTRVFEVTNFTDFNSSAETTIATLTKVDEVFTKLWLFQLQSETNAPGKNNFSLNLSLTMTY